MNKIPLFIFFVIFNCNVFALSSFIADYKLVVDNIKVATETRTLNFYENKYEYTANAKTTGVAKLFGDISIEAKSIFVINDYGVDSEKYIINESKDKELTKSYIVNISSKNNTVISESTTPKLDTKAFKTEGGNILDPLSLFIALLNDLSNMPNKVIFRYQVADGKYLKKNEYRKISNQTFMINGIEEDVIRVEEFNSDSNLTALFSPKYLYLPVVIEQTKQGRSQRYELIGLRAKVNESEELQVIF